MKCGVGFEALDCSLRNYANHKQSTDCLQGVEVRYAPLSHIQHMR